MYGYTIAYGLLVRLLHRWGFQIGGKFNLHNILISPLNDGHQFVLNMAGWYIVPLFMVEILNCMIRAFFKRKGWQIPEWIFLQGQYLWNGRQFFGDYGISHQLVADSGQNSVFCSVLCNGYFL